MNDLIDKAIQTLCAHIDRDILPDSALKYTQAALNLANVQRALSSGPHLTAIIDAQKS